MANATKYIVVLIDSLTKFPGIGRKGAERIAYFIVKSEKSLGKNLINALKEVDEKLDICPDTGMVLLKGEESPLSSEARNSEILCVVENMEDVIKIENTNSFDGLYHVLGGAISPLDGIGPDGFSAMINVISKKIATLQSGLLYHYAFIMLAGIVLFITWFLLV